MSHRILELYSGIGGMHCAWNKSGLLGEVAAAADINTVANEVYKHNFPEIYIINRNIQSITVKEILQLKVDTILMSPPCQPFSRNGKYLDENDPRTKSFLYILSILEQLDCIKYILLENVKGFDSSIVRNKFIDTLKKCEFEYQEYLLCPSSMGVPNSRLRYYCLASKLNKSIVRSDEIIEKLEKHYDPPHALELIIDHSVGDEFLVPEKLMKRAHIMDICHKESRRSCCVTKAYTHYVEGTGSVFTKKSPEFIETCLKQARTFEKGSLEYNECLKPLNLRFFTPKEVLVIMCFPENYSFPEGITRKQCYRLLGNSVNVKVISELLKLLFS